MEKEQEKRRSEHVKEFGSFLFCPKRDCLCSFQEENVCKGIECARKPCILDDEDYIELQKKQQRSRLRRAIQEERQRAEEEAAATIKNQSKQIQSYEQRAWDEIHRLEKESEKAFLMNNPNRGHTLFNEARMKRYELKEFMRRKEKSDDRR